MPDEPPDHSPAFQTSPDAAKALAMQQEIEAIMKRYGLPALSVVLIPDCDGSSRASFLLRSSPKNIFAIIPACTAYFKQLSTEAALAEQHRREKNS
jgi:hypothetical protein